MIDFQKVPLCVFSQFGDAQLVKDFFSPVKQARLQEILPKFSHSLQLEILRKIVAIDKALMHADGTLGFATATKQSPQCKMQLDRLWINLDGVDKGLDCPIRLFIQQKIQSLEIGTRQGAGFLDQMLDVNACGCPSQTEKQWKEEQLPIFEFDHYRLPIIGLMMNSVRA